MAGGTPQIGTAAPVGVNPTTNPAVASAVRTTGMAAPLPQAPVAVTSLGPIPSANFARPVIANSAPSVGPVQPLYASQPTMAVGRSTPVFGASNAPGAYGRQAPVMAGQAYGTMPARTTQVVANPAGMAPVGAAPVMVNNAYDTTVNNTVTVVNQESAAPIAAQPIYVVDGGSSYTMVSQPTYVFVSLKDMPSNVPVEPVTVLKSTVSDPVAAAAPVKVEGDASQAYAPVTGPASTPVADVDVMTSSKSNDEDPDDVSSSGRKTEKSSQQQAQPAPKTNMWSILGSPHALLGVGGGALLLAIGCGAFWALQSSSSKKGKRRVVRRRPNRRS